MWWVFCWYHKCGGSFVGIIDVVALLLMFGGWFQVQVYLFFRQQLFPFIYPLFSFWGDHLKIKRDKRLTAPLSLVVVYIASDNNFSILCVFMWMIVGDVEDPKAETNIFFLSFLTHNIWINSKSSKKCLTNKQNLSLRNHAYCCINYAYHLFVT